MRVFLNAFAFQTVWWACIAGVGRGLEIPALIYGFALATLHLMFSRQRWQEVQLAAIALVMGVLIDTLLQATSVIQFYGWSFAFLSPFWLWLLWVLFAMTLNTSLAFLQTQPLWRSALAGLVFGPLTYYAGAQMGAASFESKPFRIGALAMAWMMALPLLVYSAQQLFQPNKGQSI